MTGKINHICRVRYALISQVNGIYHSPSGGVSVSAAWQELFLSKTPQLSISEEYGRPGLSYVSSFRCWLSERRLVKEPVIVRFDFDDGKPPILIGSRDHPVRFTEDHTLAQKNLNFTHRFWAYPFRLVIGQGAGIFTIQHTEEFI